MELTAENVRDVLKGCLWQDLPLGVDIEDIDGAVVVVGIARKFGFRKSALETRAGDIAELLGQLPAQFIETRGGGWSFLNACNDKDGRQWTDFHMDMEALFALGIAVGKARWCFDRDLWPSLYGGMPYVMVITDSPEEDGHRIT